MPTRLWKNDIYDARCDYVFNKNIIEYDITKANISILREYDKIDEAVYYKLYQAPRAERQRWIGIAILRDASIQDTLSVGFREARKKLMEYLELEDHNVLHVNKDAVFVVFPKYRKIDNSIPVGIYTTFTCRGVYDSYYLIDPMRGVHGYYGRKLDNDVVKIRGIGEEALQLHDGYFMTTVNDIMRVAVNNDLQVANEFVRAEFARYNDRKVDYHCYRRFDAQSLFDLYSVSEFSSFQADYIPAENQYMVDPAFNLSILHRFGNIFLSALISH